MVIWWLSHLQIRLFWLVENIFNLDLPFAKQCISLLKGKERNVWVNQNYLVISSFYSCLWLSSQLCKILSKWATLQFPCLEHLELQILMDKSFLFSLSPPTLSFHCLSLTSAFPTASKSFKQLSGSKLERRSLNNLALVPERLRKPSLKNAESHKSRLSAVPVEWPVKGTCNSH